MFISKKKTTVKELQQLAGYLNFLTRAIVPGQTFTRRMYAKFKGPMNKLKSHHHIRLDLEFKNDSKAWLSFLDGANIDKTHVSAVYRPWVDLDTNIQADELDFFTNASGGTQHGGQGAVLGGNWMAEEWDREFIRRADPSIEY